MISTLKRAPDAVVHVTGEDRIWIAGIHPVEVREGDDYFVLRYDGDGYATFDSWVRRAGEEPALLYRNTQPNHGGW